MSGVPHHAKAGNINSVLLKGGGSGRRPGDYVVVFDCDMIAAPHFLDKAMGHFCAEDADRGWRFKNKVAFLQTPQVPHLPLTHSIQRLTMISGIPFTHPHSLYISHKTSH